MLQIGTSDTALQRELGAIKNPTLPAFNMKIEGFKQARKTTASTADGNAASKLSSQCRPSAPAQPRNNRSSNNRGRGEHDHRLALRGRCFRCAKDDHMLPQCSYPADIKCNLCSSTGHITSACSRRQNARLTQQHRHSSSPASQQLALTYDGSFPADGAPSWISPPTSIVCYFS